MIGQRVSSALRKITTLGGTGRFGKSTMDNLRIHSSAVPTTPPSVGSSIPSAMFHVTESGALAYSLEEYACERLREGSLP